jgi:hypothetical protein
MDSDGNGVLDAKELARLLKLSFLGAQVTTTSAPLRFFLLLAPGGAGAGAGGAGRGAAAQPSGGGGGAICLFRREVAAGSHCAARRCGGHGRGRLRQLPRVFGLDRKPLSPLRLPGLVFLFFFSCLLSSPPSRFVCLFVCCFSCLFAQLLCRSG